MFTNQNWFDMMMDGQSFLKKKKSYFVTDLLYCFLLHILYI